MAEVINLRRARKAKARAAAADTAAPNRAVHGETKAARSMRTAEAKRQKHQLDQAKLDSTE
jgi:hypothetical protein